MPINNGFTGWELNYENRNYIYNLNNFLGNLDMPKD